jgi:hypothetical protein
MVGVGMTTLAQAKADFFAAARQQGSTCPCCGRFGKVYKRKLHSSMVAVLVLLNRFQSLGYTHVHTLINATTDPAVAAAIRGDFAKLRYWSLIEEGREVVKEKHVGNGKWRITEAGVRFCEGSLMVQKYVWVYNSDFLGFHGEKITIYDALGSKFSYGELMGHGTVER